MKKKGFTLIELLAVIVILAIIALIATPIVLDIIEDSKNNSNLRSAENYLMAVKQSIANHQMKNAKQSVSGVYDVMKNGNLCKGTIDNDKCTGIEIKVQISGKKIMPSSITIGEDGDIASVEGLEINGKNYAYTNGSLKETTPSVICIANTSKVSVLTYVSGDPYFDESSYTKEVAGLLSSESDAYTLGVTYTCELGDNEEKTFFVLETTEDNVSLISAFNLGDAIAWSEDGNNHKDEDIIKQAVTAKTALKERTSGWTKLTESQINLPTYDQIKGVGSMPTWLYGNLNTGNGYWTSTPYASDYDHAWNVGYQGSLSIFTCGMGSSYGVNYNGYAGCGIRPVITLSKSQLG